MSTDNVYNWSRINILIIDDKDSPLCPILDSLGASYHQSTNFTDAYNALISEAFHHRPFHLVYVKAADDKTSMDTFMTALNSQSRYRHPTVLSYNDSFNKITPPDVFKENIKIEI